MRFKLKFWQSKILLVLASSIFSLLFAELVLRFISPHEVYLCSVPEVEMERNNKFHNFFSSIDSSYHYSVNEFGYRSSTLFAKNRYGILAVGGSTTDCIGLADKETWPWLLEQQLNESSPNEKFTVGSIGVPAFNSFHHVLQVKHIIPQLDNIKMVVLLVGINDFLRFLQLEKDDLIPDEKTLLHQTFVRHPRKTHEHWFQQTELWAHLRDAVNLIRKVYEVENMEFDLSTKLAEYETAIKINSLPDLEPAMKVMSNNILKINKICAERKIKLVVITQPVLWHKNMSKEEIKVSSYGKPIKNRKSYSDETMEEGMNIFNQQLLKIADQNNIYSIDLANQYPKNTTVFFDHCHYNKNGSTLVSELIFKELKNILAQE
ncbi:MAG: SGNH/GDSL hydrolase family protein [Flavobacteriales bacterium]|nr:SGNH/GDSL hydrolase family protein [Flavobacteriales bacterium]